MRWVRRIYVWIRSWLAAYSASAQRRGRAAGPNGRQSRLARLARAVQLVWRSFRRSGAAPGLPRARVPGAGGWHGTPRVTGVPASVVRLQLKAASVFLARLGEGWIPGVLVDRLRQWDVMYALRDFCTSYSIDFDSLRDPSSPGHAHNRATLGRLTGLLISFERVEADLPFSIDGVLATLGGSLDEGERVIGRLEEIAAVWRFLAAPQLDWPEYSVFRDRVRGRLAAWHDVTDGMLADIVEAARRYQRADEQLAEMRERIRESIDPGMLDGLPVITVDALLGMQEIVDELFDGLQRGTIGLADALARLQAVMHDLEDLLAALPPPPPPSITVTDALTNLGLSIGATKAQVKRAWRTLAKTLNPLVYFIENPQKYHELNERLRLINESKDFLLVELPQ